MSSRFARGGNGAPCASEPGAVWERWRLAGEFQFSAPDWPAGRRRSQEGSRAGPA